MFPESIVSGARTVLGVASHFERLKTVAAPMLAAGTASHRGFFTPTEDEQIRQLLVSYWQPRNALIELVVTLHRNAESLSETDVNADESTGNARTAAFLVAWAGALVLVDAAWFLRQNCSTRPVVLQKLNEPEPHFGIPGGTYDRIQASLTSPVHAWHLYHARDFWNQNESALVELARNTELEPLIEIVRRVNALNDVAIQQYAVDRLRVRARQMKTAGRDLIGRALYGLQKAVSSLIADKYTHLRHSPKLPDDVAQQIRQLVRPGDVFVNRKEHAFTNYFLPGYWPHAAFYIGQTPQLEQLGIASHENGKSRWSRLLDCDSNEPGRVVEAMKDGVWIRSLVSPFTADAITVIRPRLSEQHVTLAIGRALFHDGKSYDFDFDFTRSDRMVCTEVVYRSYEGLGGVRIPLTKRAGRMTLSAEDLLRMAVRQQHFEVVAAFVPRHRSTLATESTATDLVRTTLNE